MRFSYRLTAVSISNTKHIMVKNKRHDNFNDDKNKKHSYSKKLRKNDAKTVSPKTDSSLSIIKFLGLFNLTIIASYFLMHKHTDGSHGIDKFHETLTRHAEKHLTTLRETLTPDESWLKLLSLDDKDSIEDAYATEKEVEYEYYDADALLTPEEIEERDMFKRRSFKRRMKDWLIYPKNTKLCFKTEVEYLSNEELEALFEESNQEMEDMLIRREDFESRESVGHKRWRKAHDTIQELVLGYGDNFLDRKLYRETWRSGYDKRDVEPDYNIKNKTATIVSGPAGEDEADYENNFGEVDEANMNSGLSDFLDDLEKKTGKAEEEEMGFDGTLQVERCMRFKRKRKYITTPLSREEARFPIAYSIVTG